MFGWNRKKAALLDKRVENLEARVLTLTEIRNELTDENAELTTENKKLKQKRQIEEEMIAHKLKMREESVEMDANKRIGDAERKAAKDKDTGIAKVKDEYRDKLENQLEKRGDEMKEMYSEILTRLPDVNLAIKQK